MGVLRSKQTLFWPALLRKFLQRFAGTCCAGHTHAMRIEKEATACPGGGTCEAPIGKGTAARVDHHCREGWRGVAPLGVAHPSSAHSAKQV